MDALQLAIAAKRKTLQDDDSRPTKYMRRGDLEKLKQEQELKKRQASQEANGATPSEQQKVCHCSLIFNIQITSFLNREQASLKPVPQVSRPASPRDVESPKPESSFNLSNEETIRRLRLKGQPIRLFAESDKDRRLRLRALELIEEKEHERHGGQNDFKKALEDVENVERELKNKGKEKKKGDTELPSAGVLDLELLKTDPDKLYPVIYYALKRTLKEWEESMDERPGLSLLSFLFFFLA
jgi:pre-mRNA-splicing factor 18